MKRTSGILLAVILCVLPLAAEAFWEYIPPSRRAAPRAAPETPQAVPLPDPWIGPVESIPTLCDATSTFSPVIATTQQLLAITGQDPGGYDGMLTPKTREAIRAYQKSAGLEQDGCVSGNLVAKLRTMAPNPYYGRKDLRPEVLETQVLLVRLGYYIGAVDGKAGFRTTAAIRDFQASHSMPQTGQVDTSVLGALRQARAVRPVTQ
ncbi:MAG: peptidoglycan-binding protein [Pseudomonadota bacterium]|nr:peptidoglycan-binding protein [Pseudomonadota bacterium]